MAERDAELAQLRAKVAMLEAREPSADLDWLKNSEVWKRAEFNARPIWRYLIRGFVAFMFFFILGIPLIYLATHK